MIATIDQAIGQEEKMRPTATGNGAAADAGSAPASYVDGP